MSKVALFSKDAVLVSLIMSASLSFVFLIDFVVLFLLSIKSHLVWIELIHLSLHHWLLCHLTLGAWHHLHHLHVMHLSLLVLVLLGHLLLLHLVHRHTSHILNNIQNEHYKQPNGLKYDWYADEPNAATTDAPAKPIPASSDA
jgi:hypothetical protein